MRPLLPFLLLVIVACSSTKAPTDAGADASDAASMRCFPSTRGFEPGFKNGALTVSTMPLELRTIAIDELGRTLVAGAQGSDAFVARIATDGRVDTTFGTKGVVVQSFSATDDAIQTLVLDAQHRVVVGGGLDQGGSIYPFVARFSPDGAPDATFTTWIGSVSLGATRAIAIDGAGGGLYAMGGSRFVQRLLDDGSIDPAFTPVQAATGENLAGVAAQGGVIVFDAAGTLTKYAKNGTPDATFGGPVFGAMGTGAAFAVNNDTNSTGFLASDGAKPAHVATIDDKGKTVQMATVAMSVTSIGIACNRIVLGGGANGDATLGLLGLDAKPVAGDLAVDSFPVVAPVDATASALHSVIGKDGRVMFAESVIGTGVIEIARVNP